MNFTFANDDDMIHVIINNFKTNWNKTMYDIDTEISENIEMLITKNISK